MHEPHDHRVRRPDLTLSLTPLQLALELVRPWALLMAFVLAASLHQWWLAIPLATATCLAAFVQMHDTMHRALGLPGWANEVLLCMSAQALLKSGHALQITHMRHHGRCMEADDPEGVVVRWSLAKVLLEGPFHMAAMRLDSLRIAPKRAPLQLAETAVTGLLLLALLYTRWLPGLVYWMVAASLSATIPLWAAYIPHRLAVHNPLVDLAARQARFWTPLVSSFAFHHIHHAYPRVPTALLAEAARRYPLADDPDTHFHPA